MLHHVVPNRRLLLACLLVALATSAFAQDATLVGTATDPSGSAVPNVTITITNLQTGQVSKLITNNQGQYLAPGLQVGRYTIRAEMTGFKTGEQKDLVLAVGDRARVDFKLELGSAKESVTVEATPTAVQTESGEVSNVITGSQVSQLATNGRSIYSLAALTAGASSNMPDFQSATPVGGDSTVSFNGLRTSHNIYLIDGGENLDRGGAGSISVMPSVDAIGEFRQLTSNYSAEYGLSSGGTLTMIFKSGEKAFHASAWEFLRNEDLDANSFFRNAAGQPKALNRLNTYGFNVSGPVFIPNVYNKDHEKTFFFYNMEWRKQLQGGALNTTVPLTSQYGGNLGATAIHVPTADQMSPAMVAKFAAVGLSPGQAFPNNIIPTSLLDPNAQSLLKAGIFPGATSGNKFVGGNNAPTNVREEIVRIDHHFNDKLWVFGHWVDEAINQTYGTSMWSGDNVPTASNTFGNPSYSGVVHAVYTVSPSVMNEVAFNYNGNRILIDPKGVIAQPSDFKVPRLFTGPNPLNRIPGINLSGATGTNYTTNWMPWHNKADDYQIRDDVSWTRGAHQLKIGASWALYKKAQDLFANTEGGFTFNGSYTGNDFADYLLGYSSQYQEAGVQDTGHWNNQSWAAYIQDNWKVNRRLTLNLGLRWDGIPHTYEENNRQSNFYPNLYDPAKKAVLAPGGSTIDPSSPGLGTSPNSILAGYKFYLNGIGIAGQNGIPNGLVQNYWGNTFAPRVGFAYDLNGKGKTVVRGGFGVMYERIQGNDVYNAGPNVPFSAQVTFNNVSLSNPNVSLLTGQTLVAPITVADITGLSYSDYKPPASYQYSFGVQQELNRGSVVSVSYVGNSNRHQNAYRETNLPNPSQLPALIKGTVAYNSVVPYSGFHSIRMSENASNSHYNSLQVTFNQRLSHGLSVQGAYTLSKAFDQVAQGGNAQDLQNISNPYDRSYDNGPSPLDRRHIFVANFLYELPLFTKSNRLVKSTIGGWELTGIVTAETGLPLNITLGGEQGSNGLANATNRPDVKGSVSMSQTVNAWFDKTAFALPALGAWGNQPRGSVYGPGRANWNVTLNKKFVFSAERGSRLELRAETFNLFNHTQFRGVSSQFTASDFGQVTSTEGSRNLQLGIKLLF